MKRSLVWLLVLANALVLAGCHQGASAPAPTDVVLQEGDGIITVRWTMTPGVDYWLFHAAASGITTDNWYTLPGAGVVRNATSPYILTGLTNGTTYSVTINGRTDGGAGGPGSPSLSAIPRLAGASWTNGTALGASNLNGVTYGSTFVTVGDTGFIATSPDGKNNNWTTRSSSGASLNAIAYGGAYVAVGVGGTTLQSPDATTWTSYTSNTGNDLFGVTAVGSNFVAVGANGTVITSSGGTTWSLPTSITPNALYGVTYGNGRYVVVGANGTVFSSTDAVNWQPATISPSAPGAAMRGVAYGNGRYVALGDSGTLLTSTDGVNWTDQTATALTPPLPSTVTITAVTYGTQFVAVGNSGAINSGNVYTSTDGVTWALQTSGTANLNAVTHGNYGYVAVGAAGANLTAY